MDRATIVHLSKPELEFVTSTTSPLFWRTSINGISRFRNGSTFFLDAGKGPFGVTAAHVVDGWRRDRSSGVAGICQIARNSHLSLPINFDERTIDEDADMDILTYRITATEIASIGKSVLYGCQESWPPSPPIEQQCVLLAGYPAIGTRIDPDAICFGAAPSALIASSVSELDVSCMLERKALVAVLGGGIPPENFKFGGISGAAMLSVVEPNGLRTWSLAGVVHEGPDGDEEGGEAIHGLEIIRARRAHFILPDGTLDRSRWMSCTLGRNKRGRV